MSSREQDGILNQREESVLLPPMNKIISFCSVSMGPQNTRQLCYSKK